MASEWTCHPLMLWTQPGPFHVVDSCILCWIRTHSRPFSCWAFSCVVGLLEYLQAVDPFILLSAAVTGAWKLVVLVHAWLRLSSTSQADQQLLAELVLIEPLVLPCGLKVVSLTYGFVAVHSDETYGTPCCCWVRLLCHRTLTPKCKVNSPPKQQQQAAEPFLICMPCKQPSPIVNTTEQPSHPWSVAIITSPRS